MRQVNSEWHPCPFEFPIYRGQRANYPPALLWSGFASPVLPCHCALFPAEASDSPASRKTAATRLALTIPGRTSSKDGRPASAGKAARRPQLPRHARKLRSRGRQGAARGRPLHVRCRCTLAMVLTIVRGDRFCEGLLLEYLDNGLMLKWMRRLEEIDNQ